MQHIFLAGLFSMDCAGGPELDSIFAFFLFFFLFIEEMFLAATFFVVDTLNEKWAPVTGASKLKVVFIKAFRRKEDSVTFK